AAEPEAAVEPEVEVAEPQAAEAAEPETVSEPTAGTAEPEAAAPDTTAAGTGAAELPLPNYDELTIASVRARLRNLSVADLRQLIEYEKAHAARGDFVAAFERRIAKVESGK
ncbi:MAG: hypothetical protein J2P26_09000, partial [Nocardiopsaceae bacterium]|nr:hypothetical protein [Nocardiopsaceae bacterium]